MSEIIKTTEGTLTHTILSHFLDNPNLEFKSKSEAHKYIQDELLIKVGRRTLEEATHKYNKGLYSVNGITASDQVINFNKKEVVQENTLLKEDEELSEEDLKTVSDYVEANSFQKPEMNDWVKLCKKHNVDSRVCKMFWDKSSSDYSICYLNPIPPKIRNFGIGEAFQGVVDNLDKKRDYWKPVQKDSQKGLNVVISDAHVGMEIDEGGLFTYEYSAEDYKNNMRGVFNNIVKEYKTHGHFDVIVINNLGDQEDGWGGNTTRGGHKLPQNMTETEVFRVCVETHLEMIESILEQGITNKIVLRSCINSNHSASFAEIVATAVKMIVDKIYDSDIVEIDILTKFMEHRTFGDHVFILTHGKDKDKMFKGLPLNLNDKTINYLNDYIRHFDLDPKRSHIHVHKGDLHQLGFEKTVNFDYWNFGSFAPPSAWVQHNFGDSYSCYTIQVIEKYSNDVSSTNYFLNYKTKKG